jgi:cytochrome c
VLTASYTDDGNGIAPLTGNATLVLRPARVAAEDADRLSNMRRGRNGLRGIDNKSWFELKNVDLSGIKHITYNYASEKEGATIEVHTGSAKGPVIGTVNYKATGARDKYKEVTATVSDPGGKNDLYFVFRKDGPPDQNICSLDWVEFKK